MAVRPFYIESDIEGRKTMLSGGPKSGDGDMTTSIYQRNEGRIEEPYKIFQRHEDVHGEHMLVTEVHYKGEFLHRHATKY